MNFGNHWERQSVRLKFCMKYSLNVNQIRVDHCCRLNQMTNCKQWKYKLGHNQLTKLIEFDDDIILKTMKTWNCLYLSNDMKYETEIWYSEVIYDADSVYTNEIRINCQNWWNSMMSSVWKQWKQNCLYLGNGMQYYKHSQIRGSRKKIADTILQIKE